MESFPTIEGGPTSSASFTADQRQQSDPWEPEGSGTFLTMATGAQGGEQPPGGRPRIVLESAAGHQIILTYEDLVLIALAATLGAHVAGWFR